MALFRASTVKPDTSELTTQTERFAPFLSPTQANAISAARLPNAGPSEVFSYMNDAQVQAYLRDNDYPEHILKGGRAGLVRRWHEFVDQVERGYSLGIEDYRNDLDVRGILALADAEDDDVYALDARLRKLLTAT